jgi:hypothetical protein
MLKVYKTSRLFFSECDDVKFIRRGGNFDLIITKTTATYECIIQIGYENGVASLEKSWRGYERLGIVEIGLRGEGGRVEGFEMIEKRLKLEGKWKSETFWQEKLDNLQIQARKARQFGDSSKKSLTICRLKQEKLDNLQTQARKARQFADSSKKSLTTCRLKQEKLDNLQTQAREAWQLADSSKRSLTICRLKQEKLDNLQTTKADLSVCPIPEQFPTALSNSTIIFPTVSSFSHLTPLSFKTSNAPKRPTSEAMLTN